MTNKIGSSGGIDNVSVKAGSDRAVKQVKESANTASVAANQKVAAGNGVQITDSARQLAALEQAIRDVPDVDEAKVAKIRASIAQGTYDVSPDRIADKLMRLENELR